MKIPKKITPDNIKEAIVQVKFEPSCAPELVLGIFNRICSDLLEFVSGKVVKEEKPSIIIENNEGGFFIDKSSLFKIDVNGNSITFNTQSDSYPGWNEYFDFIESIINKCVENSLFLKIERIGVRYISHFDDITIFDKLKVDISVPFTSINDSTQFRSEFKYKDHRVILTILNYITNKSKEGEIKTSVIDIDVIKQVDSNSYSCNISECIEASHFAQKEIFFNLLSEDFLEGLKPEY
jgi:uncharacterized protein (TIGR04255 family)